MTSSSRTVETINGRTVSTESTTSVRDGLKTTVKKMTREGRTSVTEEIADVATGRKLSVLVDGVQQPTSGSIAAPPPARSVSVTVEHVPSRAPVGGLIGQQRKGRRVSEGHQD